MHSDDHQIALAHRTLITLSDTADSVACQAGTVWITQDNDARDIVLTPGEGFRRTAGVRTIVYALAPARLSLRHRPAAAAPPIATRQPRWRPYRAST